jgi:hypothetical protein
LNRDDAAAILSFPAECGDPGELRLWSTFLSILTLLSCAPDLWRAFSKIVASDEWYVPSLLGTLGRIDLSELVRRQRKYLAAVDKADASHSKVPDDVLALAAPSAVITQESGEVLACSHSSRTRLRT